MNSPTDHLQYEHVALETVRFHLQKMLSMRDLAVRVDAHAAMDHTIRAMVFDLEAVLIGKKYQMDTVTASACVTVPADWWQALRERWFPKFWLRRWPVRMKTVSDSKTVVQSMTKVCPHIRVPGEERHIRFVMLKDGAMPVEPCWPHDQPCEPPGTSQDHLWNAATKKCSKCGRSCESYYPLECPGRREE
jgi:hypothetical protein